MLEHKKEQLVVACSLAMDDWMYVAWLGGIRRNDRLMGSKSSVELLHNKTIYSDAFEGMKEKAAEHTNADKFKLRNKHLLNAGFLLMLVRAF